MPLTSHCSIFAGVHENAVNRILRHAMAQRPSLFNYGTRTFVANPSRLCKPIEFHPEVVRRGNPLVTEEDPLTIPGTDGAYGLEFCAQLTRLEIDLHPGNVIPLPPELNPPLPAQNFALQIEICAGIACPDRDVIESIVERQDDLTNPEGFKDRPRSERPRTPPRIVPARKLDCFCMRMIAMGHFEIAGVPGGQFVAGRLDGLEIVDISPQGLENSLECYLATTIRLALLPKLRISLETIVFEIGNYASFTIGATPISGNVPHNPAVEDDTLKVFVSVEV